MRLQLIQTLLLTFVGTSLAQKEIKLRGKNKTKERNILKVDHTTDQQRELGLQIRSRSWNSWSSRSRVINGKSSKKHGWRGSKKSHYPLYEWYWDDDGMSMLWVLPFIPIIPLFFAFQASECSCRGGILGGGGDGSLCDCFCYCDSLNLDLTPVFVNQTITTDIRPDFVHDLDETCGCVYLDPEAPIAKDDSISVNTNTPIEFDPLINDGHLLDKDMLIQSFTQPPNGFVFQNSDGTLTYTSKPNFYGVDQFEYVVADDVGKIDTAIVTIIVNAPPSVTDETVVVFSSSGTSTINVLENDSDNDGDDLTIDSFTQPSNGVLLLNDDDSFSYQPNDGFVGSDSFTYTVTDGNGGFTTGTVSLLVNDNFIQARDDKFFTNKDASLTLSPTEILGNDGRNEGSEISIISITKPSNGGEATLSSGGSITYKPFPGFVGTETFQYTIKGSDGTTDTATITIEINELPSAETDIFQTTEDIGLTLKPTSVLANDRDPDGDTLTIYSVGNPTSGGKVTLSADGTIMYIPPSGFVGTDTFEYVISDGKGGFATSNINVVVASNLEAVDDSYATTVNIPINLAAPGLLENDHGDELKIKIFSQPEHGSVLAEPDGSMQFLPEENWSGVVSFEYTIEDVNGNTDVGKVTITVTPSLNPPDGTNDGCRRYSTDANGDLVFVVECDEDPGDGTISTPVLLFPP